MCTLDQIKPAVGSQYTSCRAEHHRVKRHVTFHNVVELHPWLIYVKVSSPNDPRKKKWRSTQDNKWLSLFFSIKIYFKVLLKIGPPLRVHASFGKMGTSTSKPAPLAPTFERMATCMVDVQLRNSNALEADEMAWFCRSRGPQVVATAAARLQGQGSGFRTGCPGACGVAWGRQGLG